MFMYVNRKLLFGNNHFIEQLIEYNDINNIFTWIRDIHTIILFLCFFFQAEKKDMTVSEAGLVFSFFALVMFLLSPAMGSIVSTFYKFINLNAWYWCLIKFVTLSDYFFC